MGCLGIGIIGILLLSLFGETQEKDEAANAAAAVSETQRVQARFVTVTELFDAYAANEPRAQSEYGNQALAVRGIVSDVDLDFTDDPVVRLTEGDNELNTYFDKDKGGQATQELAKGMAAVIVCNSISEVLGKPSMRDCYVGDEASIKK